MRFPHYKATADKPADPPVKLPAHALQNAGAWTGYVAEEDLAAAVNVAILLGQPLLLTGAPGTGKTQLAYHISNQFGWGEPYTFEAKSTSTYRDLWYSYDALGRFHAKDAKGADGPSADAVNYIEYNALGKAILRSRKRDAISRYLRDGKYLGSPKSKRLTQTPAALSTLAPPKEEEDVSEEHDGPKPSVVLIDEIDKAPRDFPNDILRELEELYFRVPEIDLKPVKADPDYRPVVIITSNSEKNLPPAFLRRCTFFCIQSPSDEKLAKILKNRVGEWAGAETFYTDAVQFYNLLHRSGLEQRPGTAELIAWVAYLRRQDLTQVKDKTNRTTLEDGLATLAKSQDDLAKAKKALASFLGVE